MDFDFTSDQELFFESAKEYAEKYFTPELIKQYYEVDHHISLEAADGFPRAWLHAPWLARRSWRHSLQQAYLGCFDGKASRVHQLRTSFPDRLQLHHGRYRIRQQRTAAKDHGCC